MRGTWKLSIEQPVHSSCVYYAYIWILHAEYIFAPMAFEMYILLDCPGVFWRLAAIWGDCCLFEVYHGVIQPQFSNVVSPGCDHDQILNHGDRVHEETCISHIVHIIYYTSYIRAESVAKFFKLDYYSMCVTADWA